MVTGVTEQINVDPTLHRLSPCRTLVDRQRKAQTQSITGACSGYQPGVAGLIRWNASPRAPGRNRNAELNRGRTLAEAPADRDTA
jgi:hypothetical protein